MANEARTPAVATTADASPATGFQPGGLAALPRALHLQVATMRQSLFDGEVQAVDLPGAAGGLGIRAGHDPLLTALRPGMLRYRTTIDAAWQEIYLLGGVAETDGSSVRVLADQVLRTADADARQRAEAAYRARTVAQRKPLAAHDYSGIKAELDAELLRFFQMALRG